MVRITSKEPGHIGSRKALVAKGIELNERKRNGACIDDITSTPCARNTKSGILPFLPSSKKNDVLEV